MRHSRSGHLFLTKFLPDRRALRQSQNSCLEHQTNSAVVVLPHLVQKWWRQSPGPPPHERSLPSADVSRSLGFGSQRPGRRASPPRRGDQARFGVVAPPCTRLRELSLDRLSDHETTPVTSSGLGRQAVFFFRLMYTLTAWLSLETAGRRQRTTLHLPSWVGTECNEGRAGEFLCSSVRSRRDSRVPLWFSESL